MIVVTRDVMIQGFKLPFGFRFLIEVFSSVPVFRLRYVRCLSCMLANL